MEKKPLIVVMESGFEGFSPQYGPFAALSTYNNERPARKRPELRKGQITFWEAAGFEMTPAEKGRLKKYKNTIKNCDKLSPLRDPVKLHLNTVADVIDTSVKKGFNILYFEPSVDPGNDFIIPKNTSEFILVGHWRQACIKDFVKYTQTRFPHIECKLIAGTGSISNWLGVPKKAKDEYKKMISEKKIIPITLQQFHERTPSQSESMRFLPSPATNLMFSPEGRKALGEVSKFNRKLLNAELGRKARLH